eukprot:30166-Pelagococcus_subviridis.AAC.3
MSRWIGVYIARKTTKTRKKFEVIGSNIPNCCCVVYVVDVIPKASSKNPPNAPPVMPPTRTLTKTQQK